MPRPHILTIATGALPELQYGQSDLSWSHGDSLLASTSSGDLEVNGIYHGAPEKIVLDGAAVPRFSPSGDRIVFARNMGHNPDGSGRVEVFVVDKDGQNLSSLSIGTEPCWSPDGAEIVYNLNGNLWIMSADGSDNRQFTFYTDGGASHPSWYN